MKIRTMFYIGLSSLLGYTAHAQVKGTVQQSQIISKSNIPVVRSEAILTGVPANSDVYITREKGIGDKEFYKFRFQTLPLTYGHLSVGAAIQHVNSGKSVTETGIAAKVSGKIDDVNASLNPQYFPQNDKLDYYGTLSSGSIFGDVLGSWNTANGKGFVRSGIDYLINVEDVKIGIGVEAKFSGKLDDLKTEYIGLRLKVKI